MASSPAIPQQFGRYKILSKLGEGGMGTVYLAEDTHLTRKVAIKVPHFVAADGNEIIERFYREAKLAARIDHPNLCPVFDVGKIDGTHYLTMPYIEGTPLSKVLTGEPWAVPRAARLVRVLALALHYLHERGILHRDLKPANIMIRKDGEPVLMDFGLARALNDNMRLTRTGASLGTPAYMAPEQVNGQATTQGTDIYGLGVILFQLLTGRLPFTGSVAIVYGQILHAAPPPPSALGAPVTPQLDAVCLRAMAKKPEQRHRSMEEFARELEPFARVAGSAVNHRVQGAAPPPVPSGDGALRMVCPGCGQKLRLPARSAAPRLQCPRCGTVVTAPNASGRSSGTAILRANHQRLWPYFLLMISLAATAAFVAWLLLSGFSGDTGQQGLKDLPPDLTNSIGMKLRLIPAGEFQMGSPPEEKNRFEDETRHAVEITRPFYVGTYEVTQAQYATIMGKGEASDSLPAEGVTWDEAVEFCKQLSQQPEEQERGRVYRLPTEAEWEYACRAGGDRAYHYGTDIFPRQANYTPLNQRKAERQTKPVGSHDPNAWGLYDMHGNVAEWCSDWYAGEYYKVSPRKDPRGPDAPGTPIGRVLRGGSWQSLARDCRSAARYFAPPDDRQPPRGFRVVMEPRQSPP